MVVKTMDSSVKTIWKMQNYLNFATIQNLLNTMFAIYC